MPRLRRLGTGGGRFEFGERSLSRRQVDGTEFSLCLPLAGFGKRTSLLAFLAISFGFLYPSVNIGFGKAAAISSGLLKPRLWQRREGKRDCCCSEPNHGRADKEPGIIGESVEDPAADQRADGHSDT